MIKRIIAFALLLTALGLFVCTTNCKLEAQSKSGPMDSPTGVRILPPPVESPRVEGGTVTISSVCPIDMVEVDGSYCPNVEEVCLYNVDINGKQTTSPGNPLWSCGEYKKPTRCLSNSRVHMHFCIDKYEWPNHAGEKPQDWMTYQTAKVAVAAVGKRLCTAREWTLAAEGPEMHPLPYGDGYHRDRIACNFDRHYDEVTQTDDFKALGLTKIDVFRSRSPHDKMSQALRMFLVPSGSMPNCVSDYGVHDMAGNVDEEVYNEGGTTCLGRTSGNCISGLKGGHVWHVRNASRPMTTAHGETFGCYETGTRACKSIP